MMQSDRPAPRLPLDTTSMTYAGRSGDVRGQANRGVRSLLLMSMLLVGLISIRTTASASCVAIKAAGTYNWQTGQYAYWFPPPGYQTNSSSLTGRFWQFGNRAAGNEGACTVSSCGWLYFTSGINMYADLSQQGVVGCPAGRLATVAETTSTDGQNAAFIVGTVDETPGVGVAIAFDYSVFGHRSLMTIPRPRVTSLESSGTNIIVDITVDSAAAGAFGPAGATAISGYNIVDAVGSTDPGRSSAPYVPLRTIAGASGGSVAGVSLDCSVASMTHWLAVQVLFVDGVDSQYVGAVAQVRCNPDCQDVDGDGYIAQPACGTPQDCNDFDGSVYPGAPQLCDGKNNDCTDGAWPTVPANEADSDGDGYRVCGGDCNDANASVHPGAIELCNGIDDNCSGLVDEGGSALCDDGIVCTADVCNGASGCTHSNNAMSCDDGNACTANDMCAGGGCLGTPLPTQTFYRDQDGDGYGDPINTVQACSAWVGYVGQGGDCNDTNPNVYPGAPEICDGVDNQCSGDGGFGQIDEGCVGGAGFFDAFNRPDSGTVGNGWNEIELSSDDARISGGRLNLPDSADGAVVWRPFEGGAGGSDITMSFTYRKTMATTEVDTVVARTDATYRGESGLLLFVSVGLDTIGVVDGAAGTKGSVGFDFALNTDYRFEWSIFPDNRMTVSVWPATGLPPAFPQILIPAFTPVSQGTNWAFTGRIGAHFDDFKVETPARSPGGFFDDFNRPDSDTVGNGWNEAYCCSPSDVRILSNRLNFATGDGAIAYRGHSGGADGSNVTLSWVYRNTAAGVEDGVIARYNPAAGRELHAGLRIRISVADPLFDVWDEGTLKARTTFPFQINTDYNFQWDIYSDYRMSVWVWRTVDPKPATPTLTVSAFTPLSNGNFWAIGHRGGSFVDDFRVVTPAIVSPVCGDGRIDPPEACDDGNVINGDGCESDCQSTLGRVSQDTTIWRDWNSTCGDSAYSGESILTVATRKDLPDRYHRLLSQFTLPPAGSCPTVTGARLRMYALGQSEYVTNDFFVDALVTNWSASSATWCSPWTNTGGEWTGVGEALTVIPSKYPGPWHLATGPYNEWIEWEVTSMVSDWVRGVRPNNGLIVRQRDIFNSAENQGISFAASEYLDASLRPQLVVACGGGDLCAEVICTALDQCHDVGVCDPATGQCSNPTKANGTACDDGSASTVTDVCTSGVCVGVPVGLCGNGVVDVGEACDDGNNQNGDGCDSGCRLEDSDSDGVPDDGDESGAVGDHPCTATAVVNCDDNCRFKANLDQHDVDSDGIGDLCDINDQGRQVLRLPVFWCVVAGSQVAAETDPIAVLDDRLRRVNENIHGSQAQIELFSGHALLAPEVLGDGIGDEDGVCESADTCGRESVNDPGNANGICEAGEACIYETYFGLDDGALIVTNPSGSLSKAQSETALAQCKTMWRNLGFGGFGIVAVDANVGSRYGSLSEVLRLTDRPAPPCDLAVGTRTSGVGLIVHDPDTNSDARDTMLGHEVGHALSLRHGDGKDGDGDGRIDEENECPGGSLDLCLAARGWWPFCSPQTPTATSCTNRDHDGDGCEREDGGDKEGQWTENLMGGGPRNLYRLTTQQVELERAGACQIGAMGCPSQIRNWVGGDVVSQSVGFSDGEHLIKSVGVYAVPLSGALRLEMETSDVDPSMEASVRYRWLLDLDGHPETGASAALTSSVIGRTTELNGVELIAEASTLLPSGDGTVIASVLEYDAANGFQPLAPDQVDAEIFDGGLASDNPDEVRRGRSVQLEIPDGYVTPGLSAKIQGFYDGTIAPGSEASPIGHVLLVQRGAPRCQVHPDAARLGESIHVSADQLQSSSTVALYVGAQQVGSGVTDGQGRVELDTVAVAGLAAGRQVVTVLATAGGATATCSIGLQVAPVFDTPPTPNQGEVIAVFTGHHIAISIQASDADPLDVITIEAATSPAGSVLALAEGTNPANGTFHWTPGLEQEGDYELGFRAVDTQGLSAIDRQLTIRVIANHPPVANAGADTAVECAGAGHAAVRLDGTASSDPDSTPGTSDDIVSFEWLEDFGSPIQRVLGDGSLLNVSFAVGSHTVTLLVTDGGNVTRTDDIVVTVADSMPPLISVPHDKMAECASPVGTAVEIGSATASDLCCGDVPVTSDTIPLFPLGRTIVRWMASDCNGNGSQSEQEVSVVDTIPPVVSANASPNYLWPPNHKMYEVHNTVTVVDACDPSPHVTLQSVLSSEPDDGPGGGDGNTIDDRQDVSLGTLDLDIRLRAERQGAGLGRTYTIQYQATDASGNVGAGTDTVRVPHDQAGLVEPLSVIVANSALTVASWEPVYWAQHFDVIRGSVDQLRVDGSNFDLGAVRCIGTNIVDTDTVGAEDSVVPEPGEAFFYLVQFHDGTKESSYGEHSAQKARLPGAGSQACH